MATVSDIVLGAFRLCGIRDTDNTRTSEGITAFNDLLRTMEYEGLLAYFTEYGSLTETINESVYIEKALKYMLAEAIAPEYNLQLPPAVTQQAFYLRTNIEAAISSVDEVVIDKAIRR